MYIHRNPILCTFYQSPFFISCSDVKNILPFLNIHPDVRLMCVLYRKPESIPSLYFILVRM